MEQMQINDNQYLALRWDFILKVDGSRPILYPLDCLDTPITYLKLIDGFVLSLLDGEKTLGEIKQIFSSLFPHDDQSAIPELLLRLDKSKRSNPTQSGIGADGLIEISDSPIKGAQRFDSREFIIAPSEYIARMNDIKNCVRLDTPINIFTIFTHHCLVDCVYCYADRKQNGEMPLSRWRELITEMKSMGIWLCAPDNGDTFARKDGIDFIECLLEHEMHFLLSTKAPVSKTNVRRLVDAGFTKKVRGVARRRLQLSIDTVDENVAKRILNVKKTFLDKTVETFDNFLAAGIMPKIKTVITGLNYDQPKSIVDFFFPRGARVFHFVRYTRSFHKHKDELFITREQILELKNQFEQILEKYPDIELIENLTPGLNGGSGPQTEMLKGMWEKRNGCGGGWTALGISADGNAFLCEQMKMDEPFFVGNANNQSIREIWDGDKMLNFIYPSRTEFGDVMCSDCEEFEDCMWKKGRCYRNAYFAYGSIFEQPPLCPRNSRPGLRMT